jgi:Na+/H+-translocating membrane pyrophosphatase
VSVLGRYAAVTAAIVLVGVIAAAVVARILGHPDAFLDMLAMAAFGIVAGTAGSLTQLNGTVQRTAEQDQEIRQLRAELARIRGDT